MPGVAPKLRGADGAVSNSPGSEAVTASLSYHEAKFNLSSTAWTISTQSRHFKKEPAGLSGNVLRGVLDLAGDSRTALPFIYDRIAGKLFLDLNRNQDLTDDAGGVFKDSSGPDAGMGNFENVPLTFNASEGECRMLADLRFYDLQPRTYCVVAIRSYWQGKVTLYGREWEVGVVPNVPRAGLHSADRLLLRSWQERTNAFSIGNLAETVPLEKGVFAGGHAYQLTWSHESATNGALRFMEQSPALGDLRLDGKFLQRVVLCDGPCPVILDPVAAVAKVPIGAYHVAGIRLAQGDLAALYNPSGRPHLISITVDGKSPAVLTAGGPLKNTVVAERDGDDASLSLSYQLIGAGGEAWQMLRRNSSNPPEFTIYQNDRKIASGKFEFG